MRLVRDTNVFVSAILKANSLPFLAVDWVDQHGGLLKFPETERQLLDVIVRPHIAVVTTANYRAGLISLLTRA